jgi:hypothetical protein
MRTSWQVEGYPSGWGRGAALIFGSYGITASIEYVHDYKKF